jgi:hypothetical protein
MDRVDIINQKHPDDPDNPVKINVSYKVLGSRCYVPLP